MSDNNQRIEEEQARDEAVEESIETKQEEAMEWESPSAAQEASPNQPLTCLKSEDIDELQSRWNSLQIEFVDDPRASVKRADELVAETLDRIMNTFSAQRADLDKQWNNKDDCTTEDLRVSLQNYRSFLNRLLTL
jgi:hypothetical protein